MKYLAFMYRYRIVAVAVMAGCGGLNSLRFIGEWSNFWSVVASQCLFGRGFTVISQISLFIMVLKE